MKSSFSSFLFLFSFISPPSPSSFIFPLFWFESATLYSVFSSNIFNSGLWTSHLENLFCSLLLATFTHSGLFLCLLELILNLFSSAHNLRQSQGFLLRCFCPKRTHFSRELRASPLGTLYLPTHHSFLCPRLALPPSPVL